MPIPKRLRFEILRRDNHTCRYCGATAPTVALTIDHVIPEILGGTNDPANLVAACEPCNSGKSATPPGAPLVTDVADDAIRWSRAMEFASVRIENDRERREITRLTFEVAWKNWTYPIGNGGRESFPLPNDWPITIDRFARAGLTPADLEDAVDQAMRATNVRDIYRFFCGVAWRIVTEKQTIARQILGIEDN